MIENNNYYSNIGKDFKLNKKYDILSHQNIKHVIIPSFVEVIGAYAFNKDTKKKLVEHFKY